MIFIPEGRLGQRNTGLALGCLADAKPTAEAPALYLQLGVEVADGFSR